MTSPFRIGDRVRILLAVPCSVPKCRIGTVARIVRVTATGSVHLAAKGLTRPMLLSRDAAAACLERVR